MKVYTDGAYRDGVGGWAWWCPGTKEWRKGVETPSTNQRMELYAALDAINHNFDTKNLVIISDSAYLVNCFGERWWVKWIENGWIGSKNGEIMNRDIWEPLLEIVKKHGNVKFIWVKGHSGDAGNEKADQLATGAVTNYIREQKGESPKMEAVIEKSLEIDSKQCSYCKEYAVVHFFLLQNRKFLAACQKHTEQLRFPLFISMEYDEHPWGEGCNTRHSYWVLPIEDGASWCLEIH